MSNNSLSRRQFLARAGMGAAGAYLAMSGMPDALAASKKRPNFLFILTDDQRYDAIGCLGNPPWLKTPNMDRLVKEGMLFKNAFVTTSLCSPSRSSFLTGKYVHKTGVTGNRTELSAENITFPNLLHQAGYETAYVGKWHCWRQRGPQPGFDRWVSFAGQGVYDDPLLNIDGNDVQAKGYMTDLLNNYALEFLKKKRDKPFCLYLAHKAVHDPRKPADRHANLYEGEVYPPPASANDNLQGKPARLREKFPNVGVDSGAASQDTMPQPKPNQKPKNAKEGILRYYRCLGAVDDGIGEILKTLQENGQLDNTVIVFAGDNGYFLGEHHLGDKRWAYEEALRIPFVVRFPKMAKASSACEEMVLNIDLAPTLLDLAGAAIPSYIQGKSFKPLLQGKKTKWRDDFLYEYFIDEEFPKAVPEIKAVRTKDWKYITYPGINDIDELYDLKNDPIEMKNLAKDPKYADTLKDMKARLARLLKETK